MTSKVVRSSKKRVMLRAAIAAASLALGGLLAAPARADLISFNPTGGINPGAVITGIQSFNYTTGNVLASGIQSGIPTPGTPFNVFYQSVLGTATSGSTVLGGAGAGGNFNGSGNQFTVVAGFIETSTGNTLVPGGGSKIQGPGSVGGSNDAANISLSAAATLPGGLNLNAATPNFFQIRVEASGTSNASAGTGFADAGSTAILTGHIIPTGFTGTFKEDGTIAGATFTPHTENFNQSGTASPLDPTTTKTTTGSGGTNITVVVDSYNAAFFPSPPPQIFSLAFTTTNSLPFTGSTPTNRFISGTVGGSALANAVGTAIAANPGATNGVSGPDLEFQSVAQNSFTAVPEPSTVVMGLASLVGVPVLARVSRRRNKTTA